MPFANDQRGIGLKLALSLVSLAALIACPAEALEWRWSYQGEGVTASGAFTTKDAPNADGFYEITGDQGRDERRRHYRTAACRHVDPW